MKINKVNILILFLSLIFPSGIFSQADPTDSPDSLYALRKNSGEADLPAIDLQLATYYQTRNIDSLSYYTSLLEAYNSKSYDKRREAYILKFKSSIHQSRLDTRQSIEFASEALSIFSELKDFKEMGWQAMNLGTNYFRLGNYPASTEQYLAALAYFEKEKHKHGIAEANNGLGRISYQTKHFQNAQSYFETALDIYNEIKMNKPRAKIYNNLALVLMESEQFQRSLQSLQNAASEFEIQKDSSRLSLVYGNMAICYEELGMLDSGMFYIQKAYQIANDIEDEYCVITGLINLGYFQRLDGQYVSSRKSLKNALEMAVNKELPLFEQTIYQEFADLYADLNNYKRAYRYHLLRDSIKQIIANNEAEERISELLLSYQQEVRENELIQLRSDQELQEKLNKILILVVVLSFSLVIIFIFSYHRNRQQKLKLEMKNTELNSSNRELASSEILLRQHIQDKDKLFSIIAHDLRNPVAAVNGFSDLLNESYDAIDDDSRKEYLEQLHLASQRSMSLLENLLFWAKSQMKKIDVKKTSIEVQSFVLECEEALISSAERKQIKIEHDFQATFSLEIDVEMMNVVLRNLLSNAIKFSYPGKKIVIRCFEEAELKCISIIDEGTGIHPEVLNMILSDQEIAPSNGTRKEPGTGLGLIIARDFTEKNGGVIKVKSTPGKGTTFSICFPV